MESIITPIANEVAKMEVTAAEKKLLKALDQTEVKVEIIVSPNIGQEDYRNFLSGTCKHYAKAEMRREILFPVLGQLMLIAKNREELWKDTCENYEAFIKATSDQFGVSRSTLYEARKAIERWGDVLEVGEFSLVGRVRIKQISGVVPKGAEKQATAKKLLKVAATSNLEQLDEFIESNYHKTRPERIGAKFEIPCNKTQEASWTRFFNNAKVQAWVESDNWATIMDMLIAECKEEWISKGEAKIASEDPDLVSVEV